MRPILLTMQAFCSYGKKTTVDFTRTNQNLFLITGDTGAGKSTIFDAIVFALYGEASSGENRKNGKELQSQFVSLELPPFVELTFTEKQDGADCQFTVRREPRHLRPLKRGEGTKDVTERVTLILPDGTEFSQNKEDTDRKLEELVGLTKSQFMQVAMIAQGEFMELLRAKSDKKKEIFRKLFHTEVYQDVVAELDRRRRETLTEIAKIQTVCRTEVGHARLPERETELAELKNRLLSSDRLNVAELEQFLAQLQTLCAQLGTETQEAKAICEQAETQRDQARAALTQAQTLLGSFEELERAEQALRDCETLEAQVEQLTRLTAQIRAAWELQAMHRRYTDARQTVRQTALRLAEQQAAIPGLTDRDRELEEQESAAQETLSAETAAFTRVSERVGQALAVLDQLEAAEKTVKQRALALTQAQAAVREAREAREAFARQEAQWRQEAEALSGAETALALWKERTKSAAALASELAHVQQLSVKLAEQRHEAEQATSAYGMAREAYRVENADYLGKQTAFWDHQAGFLAAEKLRPGAPCPVCGALEHPHPCELPADHQTLTREMLEEQRRQVEELRQEMEACGARAETAGSLEKERETAFSAALEQLGRKLTEQDRSAPEQLTLDAAAAWMADWEQTLESEGTELRQRTKALSALREKLETADQQREALSNRCEETAEQETNAKTALAAAEENRKGLENQRTYPDRASAQAEEAAARNRKTAAEMAWEAAHQQTKSARAALEQAEALAGTYMADLPQQQALCGQEQAAYTAELETLGLTEPQWQQITEEHPKAEAEKLQEQLTAYAEKKAGALAARETARKAIGDNQRPELSELEADVEAAEQQRTEARCVWEGLQAMEQANLQTCRALLPQMEERKRAVNAHNAVDSLYSRLSGKVTGARMDIETYVQRYYLRRILDAANDRFRSMSAGQFELRMLDEEQAGQGKNRGLDLLVYSSVTDQEREIRTLSGGESFLAALSLALGMADQIQQSCASIHLDMMFIDEGFGSLDDHARTQAVKTLQRMAGGSRLIGIISHVTELKQQIEDQLLVSKTEEGSRIRWQIS